MLKAILGSGWKTGTGLFFSLIVAPHVGDVKIDATAEFLHATGVFLATVGVGHKLVKWLVGIGKALAERPKP